MPLEHRQLDSLARDLALVTAKVIPALLPTANRAGLNIKRRMGRDASGHAHLPGLASKVEYDVTPRPTSVEIEVGFRDEGQGELANIAAFGSVNNPPVMDITAGLDEEASVLARHAAVAAVKALL